MQDRDIVLVTGGMGYIGQHVVTELLSRGERVHIIDDLSRSQSHDINIFRDILESNTQLPYHDIKLYLHKYDITNSEVMENWFLEYGHNIKLVVHLAALKSIPESIQNPDIYYKTNTRATEFLIEKTIMYKIPKFVFSSTACVYGGECPNNGYSEDQALNISDCKNPYGRSKRLSEVYMELLNSRNTHTIFVSLRYFNPIGCHPSGLIGEDYTNSKLSNLFPVIWSVVNGERKQLKIYGTDYPQTIDGSPARDFIEISDLVNAHLVILNCNNILAPGYHCFNVGTGKSTSVIEFINLFEEVVGIEIPYQLSERRPGDQGLSLACIDKIKSAFKWKSTSELSHAILNAHKRNNLLLE